MGTHIVKPIFKPGYYRKYFAEAARINEFMKITHTIFGVDMEKIPLIWDSGNMMSNNEAGLLLHTLKPVICKLLRVVQFTILKIDL
jgi:hypothetical protein